MPEYVLNRNYVLRTTDGVIGFEKGQPAWVPPALERAAVGIGAQRVDGESIALLDPEIPAPLPLVGDERTAQLYAAFDLLVETNDAKNFTGQGVPNTKAVERLTGVEFDRTEIVEGWREYRVAKAEAS